MLEVWVIPCGSAQYRYSCGQNSSSGVNLHVVEVGQRSDVMWLSVECCCNLVEQFPFLFKCIERNR